jgi:hypothetical protein
LESGRSVLKWKPEINRSERTRRRPLAAESKLLGAARVLDCRRLWSGRIQRTIEQKSQSEAIKSFPIRSRLK